MAMVVLLESASPRATTETVTTQLPAAAAVNVVEADPGVEKEPHASGAAVQAKEIASPSASVATAESESRSPTAATLADAVSETITGE